jgi:putative Ca2+/H+ antiporter (TMEM165/GDT1 family)
MDWKLFLATFMTVFVAELGDKTQLATFNFAASGSSRWVVFGGAALALVLSAAIAVVAGGLVSRWVSPKLLTRVAAVAFIVMGVWMLWKRP